MAAPEGRSTGRRSVRPTSARTRPYRGFVSSALAGGDANKAAQTASAATAIFSLEPSGVRIVSSGNALIPGQLNEKSREGGKRAPRLVFVNPARSKVRLEE